MAEAWTDLRRAGENDVEEVAAILEEAAAWLRSRGIDQWPARWPRSWLAARIREAECYLALRDGRAAGTLSLQRSDLPIWGERPPDALYVHRLAVRRRDAGLGRRLLTWAEQAAAATGRRYLRLDCLAENRQLTAYYERAGYCHRGEVRVARRTSSLYEKDVAQP
ncbi:MAG TPA: GNAT family N-acetyltransferase [Candidatus Dormibacteraeota bacterium]|nr:GNAT family N-acetyltransferase [Candidatus Dormibacteraeota bacterium]